MVLTDNMLGFYLETRQHSESICQPLQAEDFVVQPVEFVSPPKWHLGHTTWFFEEFILKPHLADYQEFNGDFGFVFNSYYEAKGKRVVRANRGNLSRPGVQEVMAYRTHVDQNMVKLLENGFPSAVASLVEIGIHHEKQHQELLLTDIKYILGNNPLLPVYPAGLEEFPVQDASLEWINIDKGLYDIGHEGPGFCYDNELGRHTVHLEGFKISNKLVTNGEFIEFIEDGGYQKFELWHAEGWDLVNKEQWKAPLYWHQIEGEWHHYTFKGLVKVEHHLSLGHISYYEAFAFAQWKGCRLPTEFEWEAAQHKFNWGSRWEWTESAYLPYPNYQKAEGALGEYNGKFMVNQKVLRGGSVATSPKHTRASYRNFFHAGLQWQYTGIRLAKSL